MVLWGANVNEGPLAVPGQYQVRATANGVTQTQSFRITEDPRVTVSQADMQASFDVSKQVLDRVGQANQSVIDVRKLRDQINDRLKKTDAAQIHSTGDALRAKLTEVEEAIYQVRNRSGQDPLNFPIKLNNKIGHLLEVIEGGLDAKPTDQTYAAFKELSAELETQLAKLKSALATDLPAFNKQLTDANLEPVTLEAAAKK
jgi:ribosome-associated translation inhibitor RaiA